MANIKLTANEDRFVQAMERAAGSVGRLSAMLNVNLSHSMREVDAISRNFQQGFGKLGDKIQSVGQSMSTYLTLPLTLVGGAALNAYGELDSLKKGLLSIEGTIPNVEKRLVQLREAAKLPGLGFQEAIQGDVRLRSVGIAAETSLRILKEFGNAAALTGGGKEQLSQIISQLSQMAAKGKVAAQDLKPIIEAAPSVSTAIKQMFGTVDSEGIQNKLAAAGKSSTDFINDLLTALEKTPRVAGGFKNAMENLKDSLFVAAAGFGEALNKSFGLEGILNSLADKLGQLTTWFQTLSPEVQKTILTVGGLVAVAGPLLVAIGGIIALSGPVIAAIAGISLPMVAVGAVIVSFTATVIRNWGMIEAVLKDTGVWDGLVNIVKFTANVIGEVFGLLFDAVSGDWSSFGERLQNIGKRMFNGLIGVIQLFINESLNLFQSFFSLFGGTNFMTRGIESLKMGLGSLTSKIMFDVPKSTDYLKKFGDEISKIGNSGDSKTVGNSLTNLKPNWLAKLDINQIKQESINQIAVVNKTLRSVMSQYAESEFLKGQNGPFKISKVIDFTNSDLTDASTRLNARFQKLFENVKFYPESAVSKLSEEAKKFRDDFLEKFGTDLADFPATLNKAMDMSQFLTGGVENAIESAAQAIGSGGGLKKVFSNIMGIVGDFMVALGKKLFVMNTLITNALNKIGGPAGIALSLGLIVAGSALKSQVLNDTPRFAQGGMVTGPTFAMMGDNASGREMALPWEKTSIFADAIANRMGGGGGGMSMVELKVKGEDLYAVIQMHKKNNGY